jgi:prophage regulatory protein
MTDRLLKITEVAAITNRSKASIYRDLKVGRFPRPVETGPNSVRWPASVVDAWVASRPLRDRKPTP